MPKAKPQTKPSVGRAKADSSASQAKRRDASANIVDKLDAEASTSSTSAAKKRKRSLEEEVSKCLKDNFRGWSEAMTDLTLRGGVSLREKITADKLKIKSGDRVDAMGKYYYQSLRDEFGGHDVALRLQVRDPTQEENQLLVVGLKGVLQHEVLEFIGDRQFGILAGDGLDDLTMDIGTNAICAHHIPNGGCTSRQHVWRSNITPEDFIGQSLSGSFSVVVCRLQDDVAWTNDYMVTPDPDVWAAKVIEVLAVGKDDAFIVIDFDRTITKWGEACCQCWHQCGPAADAAAKRQTSTKNKVSKQNVDSIVASLFT